MLTQYINKALKNAKYKILENGSWFGEIPGFDGVWANAIDLEGCRNELIEVLEEWVILKLRDQDDIPDLDGTNLFLNKIAV